MLPPPALTVSINTAGNASGTPPTTPAPSESAAPPSTRLASALVPPMSSVKRSVQPTASPARRAPTTPPAGPESASAAACAAAAGGGNVPPLEVMMRSTSIPRRRTSASARATYADTFGRRYASAVVVLVRSYSRNSGRTSQLGATGTPGSAARSASARRRSCAGWRKANRQAIATASGPRAATAVTTRRTSASVNATSTPSGPMRSRAPMT